MSELFEPYPVETHDLMLLFTAAGWTWDYWGKFYGPTGIKTREIKHVLGFIRAAWSCPRCKCEGCTYCNPNDCHNDGWTRYDCVQPFVDEENAWRAEKGLPLVTTLIEASDA